MRSLYQVWVVLWFWDMAIGGQLFTLLHNQHGVGETLKLHPRRTPTPEGFGLKTSAFSAHINLADRAQTRAACCRPQTRASCCHSDHLCVRLRGGSAGTEADDIPCSTEKVGSLTVSTFNMWCPLFRRLPAMGANGTKGQGGTSRESLYPELYMQRHEAIIRMLLRLNSDIVCLQEFWVGNEEMVGLYRSKLEHRYQWQQLNRSGARGDGIVTLLRHSIGIRDRRDILMHDMGDRVALLLRLHIPVELSPTTQGGADLLLVNTHLVFAHQPYFSIIRMRELRQILSFLELYRQTRHKDCPVMLCGDFNGPPNGFQYRHLRKLNFTSSCADDTRWVTHKNHLGVSLCCDYIFTLNPSQRPPRLERDWQAMVFHSTRQRLSAWIRRRMAQGQSLQAPRGHAREAERSGAEGAEAEGQSGAGLDEGAEESASGGGREMAEEGAGEGGQDPWATVDVSFHREALSQLGYRDVVPSLTDEQVKYLLAGPDRTYVDHDRLMDAGDVFRLFDLDTSGGLDVREFTFLCSDLEVRTDRAASEVFRRLDSARRGHLSAAQFARWWKGVLPSAWGVGDGCKPAAQRGGRARGADAAGGEESRGGHVGREGEGRGMAGAVESGAAQYGGGHRSGVGLGGGRGGGGGAGGGFGVNLEYELKLAESTVFPRKLQAGVWDDKFALSDHGVVTCRYEILPPRGYCSAVEYRAAVDYLSRSPVGGPTSAQQERLQREEGRADAEEEEEEEEGETEGSGPGGGVRRVVSAAAHRGETLEERGGGAGAGEAAEWPSDKVESESQMDTFGDAKLLSGAVRVSGSASSSDEAA